MRNDVYGLLWNDRNMVCTDVCERIAPVQHSVVLAMTTKVLSPEQAMLPALAELRAIILRSDRDNSGSI